MNLIYRKVVIAQHERGLVLKDKQVVRVLEPGVQKWFAFGEAVELIDTRVAKVSSLNVLAMIDSQSAETQALVDEYFTVLNLKEYEVALVFQRGALREVIKSGERVVFWKGANELEVKRVDTRTEIKVEKSLVNILARRTGIKGLTDVVFATEVAAKSIGLLFVDGEMVETLSSGLHAFWKLNRSVKVEHLDLRLQSTEIQGQEILTRDKVSLRINLSASFQLADAVKARLQVNDYQEHLYRQLQFALREAVGTKTLDALLADKQALNGEVFRTVVNRMAELGVKVTSVGVKDIILPGEMKEILNHVVATEKAAQANVIKRREETAATRSLLNTAKLMEANPTLLRLKEMETLEKVVEKVEKLNVYDGLEGLLKETVRLT